MCPAPRRDWGAEAPGQHRVHEPLGPQIEKVQVPQKLDPLCRDSQFLPSLPQGALPGRLSGLHPSAGEAHLPAVVVQLRWAHLIQKAQPLRPLHQRHQHGKFTPRLLQGRPVLCQFPSQRLLVHTNAPFPPHYTTSRVKGKAKPKKQPEFTKSSCNRKNPGI